MQARVVLETRGTTKDEFISTSHFSEAKVEQYQEFIKKKSGATHVVIGITYGYQFFLMLETTCGSEKEKLKVQGNIELKIMSPVQGKVEGLYKTNEENKLNELKVRIHGTVHIPSNPVSLQEAIEIYIKKSRTAFSQINEAILDSITGVFEDISNSEVALSGIQTSDIAIKEPRIRRKAKKLSTLLKRHKIRLQMKLHEIMSDPKIEKESSESKQIQKVLEKHEISPFSSCTLDMYIAKMENELRFIENLVAMLTSSHKDDISGHGQTSVN
ncbi:hypothetical protein CHS0354_035172 [Potamilus streckersoni]|uniref:Stonustoxin-like helical domain-containing protein n=1 Tax=Potamilus streckersoni TaxID=2493646 RepID=A0AAE0TF25_9BIVA|nr:hypothetical protein CHS0354_035172 [Potamilus streckersoni]